MNSIKVNFTVQFKDDEDIGMLCRDGKGWKRIIRSGVMIALLPGFKKSDFQASLRKQRTFHKVATLSPRKTRGLKWRPRDKSAVFSGYFQARAVSFQRV